MLDLLNSSDRTHEMRGLLAAEGFIELGMYDDAAGLLLDLPPAQKSTIQYFKLWIRVYAAKNAWTNVELMCESLALHAPDDPFLIHHTAEAYHRQGRSREAFAVFNMAPIGFKEGEAYFYALARFLCGVGDLPLARRTLAKATRLNSELKQRALTDPDFEKLWTELQKAESNRKS